MESEKLQESLRTKVYRAKPVRRVYQTVNLEEFVKRKLNPIIRGWGRYFAIGFSKTLFKQLDSKKAKVDST